MHAVCGLSPLDRNNESVKNIYMNGSQIHGENDKGTLLEHKSEKSSLNRTLHFLCRLF